MGPRQQRQPGGRSLHWKPILYSGKQRVSVSVIETVRLALYDRALPCSQYTCPGEWRAASDLEWPPGSDLEPGSLPAALAAARGLHHAPPLRAGQSGNSPWGPHRLNGMECNAQWGQCLKNEPFNYSDSKIKYF